MAAALTRGVAQRRRLRVQLDAMRVQVGDERTRRVESEREGSLALWRAKREESTLRQSKERFLEVVSHELRTPLASIAAATEILSDETHSGDSRREWIDMALESARRLTRTVERVEELVQLESQAEREGYTIITLDEVLDELRYSIVEVDGLHDVRCLVTWPARPIGLEVHGGQLARMLELLLENALRFSPAGATASLSIDVMLATHPDHDRVRFAIDDDGPGVPPEQRRAIFESFHQVRENLSDKPIGIGLGLTICTAIAGNLGCRIRVEPREPHGSRFVFELPCRFRKPEDRIDSVGNPPRQWMHEYQQETHPGFVVA
ncbi:MAG: HAMP domain-containing histidine kinase [Planctomycetes bacterium]|nr:HAMP domain-containing histidine kinase [Planctomycetota bacterium]